VSTSGLSRLKTVFEPSISHIQNSAAPLMTADKTRRHTVSGGSATARECSAGVRGVRQGE
jgi:hypothetical protein